MYNFFLLIVYVLLTSAYIFLFVKKKRAMDICCAVLWGICMVMKLIEIMASQI